MNEIDQIYEQCTNILPGHGRRQSLKEKLLTLADSLDGTEDADTYGRGDYIASFEAEIAEQFGKEAGVFLPSGIMAQQIALRVWCDRQHNYTIAMHPTAHLEFAENLGYQALHHLQRLQFGAPELVGSRLLTVQDFIDLPAEPGAVLLELPYRPLGGQLPPWEELVAIAEWARERQVPLHMDGARIWQCRPFYQKDFAEIAALFDSVYVSFYKDLGGLCGAMLLGSSSFINEARMWQVRHGGRLFTQGPYVASARRGWQQALPQIEQWVSKAQAVAAVLSRFPQITVNPNPPQVNMFQLYIQGDAKALTDRHMALAKETGAFLFFGLRETAVPHLATTEIHCWENALTFDLEALEPFVTALLQN